MSLADTNLGSMTSSVQAPAVTTSKVEGLTANVVNEPVKVDETQTQKGDLRRDPKAFDVLARKERAILQERQRLAVENGRLLEQAKQIESWKAEKAEFERKRAGYKTNPNTMLADFGLTYQDLSEFQLNDGTPTPQLLIKQQQDRIDALEARIAKEKSDDEVAGKKRQEQVEHEVKEDFRNQIATFIANKPDEYEYTKINEAENLVYDTVEQYYNKTGKILPIKKAADMVEEHLANIVEKKILASKKLQAKIKTSQTKEPDPQTPRTLSNSITTTSSPYNGVSPRNEADRIARAMAKLEGR